MGLGISLWRVIILVLLKASVRWFRAKIFAKYVSFWDRFLDLLVNAALAIKDHVDSIFVYELVFFNQNSLLKSPRHYHMILNYFFDELRLITRLSCQLPKYKKFSLQVL